MNNVLKLMPDYHCFPLWRAGDEIGNLDPESLPITRDLKDALSAWASAYDKTLNQDYPPDSGFATLAEENAFENEAMRLKEELRNQLGSEFVIV